MEYKTIEYSNTQLVIGYEVNGTYVPETRDYPAEYPDYVIKEIETIGGDSIYYLFTDDMQGEIIEIIRGNN